MTTNKTTTDTIAEEWRDVRGYEGYYQISSEGRFRSLDREVNSSSGGTCRRRGILLKPQNAGAGYLQCNLNMNGEFKREAAHRLVAMMFIPNPENKPQVNHKNGVRCDNRVSNLEWCTSSENNLHAFRILKRNHGMTGVSGYKNKNSREVAGVSISTGEKVRFGSLGDANLFFGGKRQLSSIIGAITGYRPSAYGYKWEYVK